MTPGMTPFPVSRDLAHQMRDRLNETKAQGGAFAVEISDQELTSYVVTLLQSGAGEFPARDMQIRFGDGYLEVWATFVEIAPTDVPVYVQAQVEAIGGTLQPEQPFAACGRNIGLLPTRGRMEVVSDTLRAFCRGAESDKETDGELLELLGEPTDVKQWLAASLEKTMRLQMHPSAELRAMSALAGPDWITQPSSD